MNEIPFKTRHGTELRMGTITLSGRGERLDGGPPVVRSCGSQCCRNQSGDQNPSRESLCSFRDLSRIKEQPVAPAGAVPPAADRTA